MLETNIPFYSVFKMFNCCEGLLVKVTARLSSDQQHRLQVHTVLVVLGRQCYTVRI